MKKLRLLLAVLLLILAGCSNSAPKDGTTDAGASEPAATGLTPSNGDSVPAGSTTAKPTAELTADEATAIALKHAGFTAEQVTCLHTERDREQGGLHYDVEFHQGGYEYDYEIDAASGSILSSQKERDD